MRVVLDALDAVGARWFITGAVATSVHGVLRQTHATDVVVDLDARAFGRVARLLGPGYAVAEPVHLAGVTMASAVEVATAAKVDLILRSPGRSDAPAQRDRSTKPGRARPGPVPSVATGSRWSRRPAGCRAGPGPRSR